MQSFGIKPDILVCRTEAYIPNHLREKIALFCNVKKESVIANRTASCLYEVPLLLEKEGLGNQVCEKLHLEKNKPDNQEWENMVAKIKKEKKEEVTIAIVGKYVSLEDSYLSVIESIKHAGYENNVKTNIKMIDAETLSNENIREKLKDCRGIIVPGGFGKRGIEGKILAIQFARENRIPFLGICLGMQLAVVEFARNVLHLEDANSEEFEKVCKNPVIHIMEYQKNITKKGGTMRLRKLSLQHKKGKLSRKSIWKRKNRRKA